MKRVARAATAAFVALACAAPASTAQSQVFDLLSATPATTAEMAASVNGRITIQFRGDPAAGCEAEGLCGVSGTISWEPGGAGSLAVVRTRLNGRRISTASLTLGLGEPGASSPTVRAEVDRSRPGGGVSTCTDLRSDDFAGLEASTRGGTLDLGFGGDSIDVTRNRCAGPVESDLARALPSARLAIGRLMRGRQSIDLSGTRAFSAHGLSGTVTSSLRLRTGRSRIANVRPSRHSASSAPYSLVSLHYRVIRVSGQVPLTFSGLGEPALCAPLDSCGLNGTVILTPLAAHGDAELDAIGPSRRTSTHDLRVALGLAPGRPRPDIPVNGYVSWTGQGTTVASVTRDDGSSRCVDSMRLAADQLSLGVANGRLTAGYSGGGLTDPLRTRCPGPILADVAEGGNIASGSVPVSALRHRTVTIRLTHGASGSGQGYAGSTRPDMTVVLRRTR